MEMGMSLQGFSKTAMATASRTAHQIIDDDPKILSGPIALRFIDGATLTAIRARDPMIMAMANPATRSHFCLRNRVAEDCMKRATARGVEQHIILGAGLDSFAYRQPAWARSINILEVDHPKTQQLKLELVKSQGLGPPANGAYLSIDFARESLLDRLKRGDIDARRPIFVSWLGVSLLVRREPLPMPAPGRRLSDRHPRNRNNVATA
jgi:methyltransferase (TIGR00027 family)